MCIASFGWSQCHKSVKMGLAPFKNTYDIMGVKKTLEKKMNVGSCLTIDCYWFANYNDWPMCDNYI
jgi:hypothetical protein